MIPERNPYNNWQGNGLNKKFDFDFYIENATQLAVYHTNAQGEQTLLIYNRDYSINEFKNENGSYITFPLNSSEYGILQEGEVISLCLTLPISQENPYGKSDYLDMKTLEYSLDYLTRICQIINRQMERSVKVQEGLNANADELFQEFKDDVNSTIETARADIATSMVEFRSEVDTNINEQFNNFRDELLDANTGVIPVFENQVNTQISDFREEVNTAISTFERDTNEDINDFKTEITTDIATSMVEFRSEVDTNINEQFNNFRDELLDANTGVIPVFENQVNTQISDFREEVNTAISTFERDTNEDINDFKTEITTDIATVIEAAAKINEMDEAVEKCKEAKEAVQEIAALLETFYTSNIDGGNAASVYHSDDVINGGDAFGSGTEIIIGGNAITTGSLFGDLIEKVRTLQTGVNFAISQISRFHHVNY